MQAMHHTVDIKQYWEKESLVVLKLRQQGAENFFSSFPNIESAFQPADRWLRCIDEGCPGGVHLTGSGILLGLQKAVAVARAAGVTAVTSHEECGAAKLAAQQAGFDVARSDDYGKEFAAKLAKRLGVSYVHLPLSEMARLAGLHVARVIYYDGTGTFDSARFAQLPSGFVISRRYLAPEYAQRECEIAVGIALGEHGFGKLFTLGEPLVILVLGHPSEVGLTVEKLRAEVESIARRYGGRVVVADFRAPCISSQP